MLEVPLGLSIGDVGLYKSLHHWVNDGLMALFFFVIMRVLKRASSEKDAFSALAMTGLVTMFGLQACINMGVNVALLPAKGMTLPFISYGGSSLLGTALAMGFVLALARRTPSTRSSVRAVPSLDMAAA